MHYSATLLLPFLSGAALAWDAPTYDGLSRVWESTFVLAAGSPPSSANWNTIQGDLGVNNELQTYTSSSRNLQCSGGGTLQLVPWRDSSATNGWTSARIESKYTFTPQAGKRTRAEAAIRFGGNAVSTKQGIWPAFWMLGDAIRHGTVWPACGELDILETVNGVLTGHGTAHCDVAQGGVCNEGNGLGGTIAIPDQDWHTWRIEFDRTAGSWTGETITWFMDGKQFHQISGGELGNQGVWAALCHSPMYFLLNVAVGGSWVCLIFDPFLSCTYRS